MKFPEKSNHAGGYLRRYRRAAGHGFANIFKQFRGRRTFQQISAGARAKRVKDAIIVVINGQHQDLHLRITLFEDANSFDAVHSRQTDIAEQYVRNISRQACQGIFHRRVAARTAKAAGKVYQRR
jgi:hypothetical protein